VALTVAAQGLRHERGGDDPHDKRRHQRSGSQGEGQPLDD